ncbi:hypothetical protein E2C01_079891 [Portunus trituberculatus]|uniref:Uncharacterized protein n=1 Tax=Portunus trituberculatus TaxID=210409 RepID=A0A5B7II21_PORTR|nr:hypothetical protein [Portunus trituberculatus]
MEASEATVVPEKIQRQYPPTAGLEGFWRCVTSQQLHRRPRLDPEPHQPSTAAALRLSTGQYHHHHRRRRYHLHLPPPSRQSPSRRI